MNSPVNAPFPRSNGSNSHFDFEVYNPNNKYTIRVIDADYYLEDSGSGLGGDGVI